MCGLVGWVGGGEPGHSVMERASRLLRHRGPDDHGFEQGQGWGVAFRRLSILDLSPLGHQPMSSPDRRFVLAFNGEIYNYIELRRELEREGERFRSGSDTEVLLCLLARQGVSGLSRLNGMFALLLVDTEARTFVLARDRLGVKPLFYTRQRGQIRFASELKALLAWPDAHRNIEPGAVVDYLGLGYLPETDCIFAGYSKLEPAGVLHGSLDDVGRARTERYWDLALNDERAARPLTSAEGQQLEDLLADSVRIRLRSDVPVGVFLSGGIDSALVAAAAAKVPGANVMALTVSFDEAFADETALAQATAEHLGLRHYTTVQDSGDLADVDQLAWYYDEPFGDPSALSFFALCKVAAKHATVFLSGDGGDEAFGGYRRYIETLRFRRLVAAGSRLGYALRGAARLTPPLSVMRYRLQKLALPDEGAAAAFDGLPADPVLSGVLHPDLRGHLGNSGECLWRHWGQSTAMRSVTARQQQLDYAMYLPGDILTKVDRASMAHSLEVRSPFLDYRLVEWAARLPRGTLLDGKEGKLPLRALAARKLPRSVAQGRKNGFSVPLDQWFRTPAGIQLIRERLLSSDARPLRLWDGPAVERILSLHCAGRGRAFGTVLWRLLMLQAWSRHYCGSSAPEAQVPPRQVRPHLAAQECPGP